MKITIAVLMLLAGAASANPPSKSKDEAILEGPGCAEFRASMQKHRPEITGVTGEQAMTALMSKVKADVPAKEYKTCSEALLRGVIAFQIKVKAIEAKQTLKQIASLIQSHYATSRKLCSSTRTPAPAKLQVLEKGDYRGTSSDWKDKAWSCMGVSFDDLILDRQHFQYAMQVAGKRVELIARGYAGPENKVITVTSVGTAAPGATTFTDPVLKDSP